MALIKKIPFWLLLLEIPLLYLAWQYFTRSSLEVYDASSHLAQIGYIKNYLWPQISGFNSFNLLGFDQGLLYPSLFHYISATLAFFVGIEVAAKLVIAAALVLLPVSIYGFSGVFFRTSNARAFVTGTILVGVYALPGYFGADIKGLVQIGLLPSFVSLPLVFLYLWSVLKPKPNFILSGLLLSAVILTHLVAGLFCLLLFLSVFLVQLCIKKFDNLLVKQLLIALGLSAFFLVPFIFNYSLISQSVHLGSLLLPNIAVLVFLVVASFLLWKTKVVVLFPVAIAGLLLAVVVLVDAVALRYFNSGFFFEKIYNLHLYRYQTYLYLLTAFLAVYWPTRFLFESQRKTLIRREYIVILPILVLVFASFIRAPFITSTVKINISDKGSGGRFLELFSREDSYPYIYSAQNKLAVEENKPWAYGLLTDSTPNGPYLGSLIRSFDPFAKDAAQEKFIERRRLDRVKVYDALNLFGIENLMFLDLEKGVDAQSINVRVSKSGVGKSLVEIPKWEIKEINGNWNTSVEEWWFEKGKFDTLLVESEERNKFATNVAEVKNLKHSEDWSKFSFEVDSSEKVPVLVKFTFLSGWKATVAGKEIQIHKASPNLMLVYASGKVEFEYRKLWYQNLSLLISSFTLVGILVALVRKPSAKNVKRHS